MSLSVVGSGPSVGSVSNVGSGGPTSCWSSGNWADTGLQQASLTLLCQGSGSGSGVCQALYDVRYSCSPVVTVAPPTNSSSQLVCFQPYNNNTCGVALGGPQCSFESRCTHTDTTGGLDESTLQTCNNGYVTISVYKNSSSCRPSSLAYSIRVNTSGCQTVGIYPGTMSCGKL